MKKLFLLALTLLIPSMSETMQVSPDVSLIPVGESFYIHETFYDFPGFGRFPSNGLIYIKNGKALLVDTPPSSELTETLSRYLSDSLSAEIVKVIACHSHEDCLGGLPYLHGKSVPSIASAKTKEICEKDSLPIPSETFTDSLSFSFEGETVLCNYFGGGHTVDNSTVYFPKEKILFGGCLIKSLSSSHLGNTREAIVEEWDQTVRNIQKRYSDIEVVVPGHGLYGNSDLLAHTITLVEKHQAK